MKWCRTYLPLYVLVAFIIATSLMPAGGEDVETANVYVREIKLDEYGIVINDSYGPILVTNMEIDDDILSRVYGQMKDVECVKPGNPMEHFKVVDSINELGGMIEEALKEELGIHSHTYIPLMRGGCGGKPCPLHILLYISRHEYRRDIREHIASIVAEQFGSTYYGEKLCDKPPEVTIYITSFNPIVYVHQGSSSCGISNCSKYFEQEALYLVNGSGEPFLKSLGFKGSYLIGLGVSFDVPYISVTIFYEKYLNKTISKAGLQSFIEENREAISVLNRLIRKCGCVNNDALLVIRLTNMPYIEVEAVEDTLNDTVQPKPPQDQEGVSQKPIEHGGEAGATNGTSQNTSLSGTHATSPPATSTEPPSTGVERPYKYLVAVAVAIATLLLGIAVLILVGRGHGNV